MITLRNVTLRRGKHILIEELTWTIYQQQHIGVIGANGCGKTSLFNLLLGNLTPDLGDIGLSRQLKIAHVAQETPAYQQSALEFVLEGDQELKVLEQALTAAENAEDGEKIALIHEQLSIIDAYTARSRAAQLLDGLGFSHEEQQKSVNEFSGGWRVRLNLAQALMCRSDVLLLDEPTNHLDLDAVVWLEQWLMRYPGTLLLISHDRDFLDKTVGHIAHIDNQRLKLYTGDYSTFEKQRAEALLLQQKNYEKQQKQISHMMKFVNRFGAKATKAKQAQSRLKAIERMDVICAVQAESPFYFEFKPVVNCPTPLIQIENATIAYGEKVVLQQLKFSIMPGERIAILGPNGAGKSSFIKLLAGELAPAKGECHISSGLKIGYFAQHQVDHLNLEESPLEHLKAIAENAQELELRKFLGGFDFTGDKVKEAVGKFSGGEKSRLALALIVWQRPHLLLLDEPTNHLDLEMRQALSIALQAYEGAMILVSHDRFLVRSTTDSLLLVANGSMEPFTGDLQDYQRWLLDFRKENTKVENASKKIEVTAKGKRLQDARERELRKPLLQKIKKFESEMEKLQKQMGEIEKTLADSDIYHAENKTQLQNILLSQSQTKKLLETIEHDWLKACEEYDKF